MRFKSLAAVAVVLLPSVAAADFYRYTTEDGTICFTDTPGSRDATLVLREQRRQRRDHAGKANIPPHLHATGIAERISTENTGESFVLGRLPLPGRISSHTGLRTDPIDGNQRLHNGVDIAVAEGTPVKPVGRGTVVFSGIRPGYGNMVVIDHGEGAITVYAHNSLNMVSQGERVGEGTTIALSGSTGRSTGPHLHFEAWKNGENVTETCVPVSPGGRGPVRTVQVADPIRRYVEDDGTLVFTNLR